MSKILKISGVIIVLLLIGGAVTWHYLPTMLAKAIVNESGGLHVIPKEVKHSINEKADEVPKAIAALEAEGFHITIDEIIRIIDEAKVSEITQTIDKLENTKLTDTDQVIGIVLENMDLGKLEHEKVVAIAKQKLKMSDVKKAMKMIRENGKPYALTIPMGKETAKSILLEKQKEVETKLNP